MIEAPERHVQGARWQRALLPSELYRPAGRRSVRDGLIDALVILGAAALGALTLSDLWGSRPQALNAIDLAAGSAACIALWARRGRPVQVALFATAISIFSAMAVGAALVSIFNAASRGRGRPLIAVAIVALTASTIFPLVNPAATPILRQRFPGFMFTAIAFGWGLYVRARRELIVSLHDRAEQAEREQQRTAQLTREAERRRIAREMHDVLAHRLSLLSVHAGALEFRPDAEPEQIAQAAAVIRSSAASALAELREVIAVLRENEDGAEPPQPMLAQVPHLLDESRAAGMTVRARIDVPADDELPPALTRTAYRVIQEGLTNARKHAAGARVDVTVRVDHDAGLVVEVLSRGAGWRVQSAPALAAGGGAGLIGLAERVSLVGGELEQGPAPNGDFVLRATLPRT